jgi:2,4-dienoyl-CoA reductase-like NADH-dependent reductase (Old Yellow Enzyme family)/thioredoxin reductase
MAKASDPINVGPMRLKNRLVGAPLLTVAGWVADGPPLQGVYDLYQERAEGGVGLVQVEAIGIFDSGSEMATRTMVRPHHLEGLARIADAIHKGGAKATVQLYQGGRQHPNVEALLSGKGDWRPVAPSDKTPPYHGWQPRSLTADEVEEYLDQYALAAFNAKQAGFDGVLFHGAHGFLPQQFLSPYTNVGRDDKYGGDRVLFAEEMIKRSRAKVGPDFALILRISGHEGMGDRGLTPTLIATEIAPRLVAAGLDAIDVSGGNFETFYWVGVPLYMPRGVMIPWAEEIQKAVDVPVIGVGRITHPRLVEKILAEERVSLVALGRALMADPDFPRKMLEGRWDDIRQCIACGGCPWMGAPEGASLGCAINPFLGLPAKRAMAETRADKPKRVVVVGGGVGGLEAADVAAARGHDVTLIEKTDRLGGLVNLSDSIPRVYTRELGQTVPYMRRRLEKEGVKIETGKEATVDDLKGLAPDVVVVATGSAPVASDIPGAEMAHVLTQEAYLETLPDLGEKVVVVGALGAELSLGLARMGKQVVLLDERADPDANAVITGTPYLHDQWRSQLLMELMHGEPNLRVRAGAKVKAITGEGVVFNYRDLSWEETAPADNVILALGRAPRRELADALRAAGLEVREVGDCVEPRTIWNAVHEGAAAALEI